MLAPAQVRTDVLVVAARDAVGGALGGRLQDVVSEFSVGRLFEYLGTDLWALQQDISLPTASEKSWHCR